MAIAEVNLVKIGKIATPAALVFAGTYLASISAYGLGIALILFGAAVYIVVWFLVKQIVVANAEADLKKERLKLKRENVRKERERLVRERTAKNKELIEDRLKHRVVNKILDAL